MSVKGYAQTVAVPDPAFLNFLKSKYAQTINTSDQLIISVATQVTGSMECLNLGITNLESVQYFTGISSLDASYNSIVSVPSFLPMINLKSLHLNNNLLVTLPGFTGMLKLKSVFIYQNLLTELPRCDNNPMLDEIIASKNNLTSIAGISTVTTLVKFDVGENKLTSLPDLGRNVYLEELICWSNKLSVLPDLTPCTKLFRLNAGKNKLTQTPDLSANPMLTILALDNNLLTLVPSIAGMSNLTSVKLYNNYFTFEDLLPLTALPNFSTVYTYSPMLPVVGDTVDAYYNETVVVHSNIDTALTNVTYDWYEGVANIGTGLNDAVSISQSSGVGVSVRYVYVRLTHSALPNLILKSDSIVVYFNACPTSSNVTYVATKKECSNVGDIGISVQGYVAPNTIYILTSVAFGNSDSNASGLFTGLVDTTYALKIDFSATCILNYSPSVKLPLESCKDIFITPNNDGDADSYLIPGSGSAVIYDKNGNVEKKVTLPYLWDGSGKQGLVPPGYYIVVINGGKDRIYISVLY